MRFQTKFNETFFVSKVLPDDDHEIREELANGLSIIWNTGKVAQLTIDSEKIVVEKDCVIFLTEYHQIEHNEFEQLNLIRFNRPFYCVEDYDHEVGCKGLLFFGGTAIPKITIPKARQKQFNLLWEVVVMEMEEGDELKLEMLRALLKRFLILFLRVYKNQHTNLPNDNISIGLIREYNYLVEKNFKALTKVADYAKLLHKSPKTLSNIFKKYIDKTPLQIINERRLLEAKRLLKYTQDSILEISEKLNFKDVQSFSHFFNARVGQPPSVYRSVKQ